MLFIDYSSAFNTIVPFKLVIKLRDLGLNSALCDWILTFYTRGTQIQILKVQSFNKTKVRLLWSF